MAEYLAVIGQILGFVAVALGFLSYQVKSAKGILVVHMLTCIVFSGHYLLLNAIPAFVLNAAGVIRDIVYYYKDRNRYAAKIAPVFFTVLMLALGMLSWQNAYSIFVVLGIAIHTACLVFKNPQNIRKSILVTSPMVLIYDIFANAIGGAIYEAIVIISSVIGIIRYSKPKKNGM